MVDDFDGFDEPYSSDDFSSDDLSAATAIGQATYDVTQQPGSQQARDNLAQTIANVTAQPQVGLNRSNIIGSSTYDPKFSQAFDISRGLLPSYYGALPASQGGGMGFMGPTQAFSQGLQRLDLPSNLVPQIEGRLGPRGPKYFSEGERVLQEVLPDIVRNVGIAPLVGRLLNTITDAGKTVGGDIEKGVGALGELKDDVFDAVKNFFSNPSGAADTENINFNVDPMPGGRAEFVPDFGVTRAADTPSFDIPAYLAQMRGQQEARDTDIYSEQFDRFAPDFIPDNRGIMGLGFDELAEEARKNVDEMRVKRDAERFSTTTPNFDLPGFSSRSMSPTEADEVKRRLGVL